MGLRKYMSYLKQATGSGLYWLGRGFSTLFEGFAGIDYLARDPHFYERDPWQAIQKDWRRIEEDSQMFSEDYKKIGRMEIFRDLNSMNEEIAEHKFKEKSDLTKKISEKEFSLN